MPRTSRHLDETGFCFLQISRVDGENRSTNHCIQVMRVIRLCSCKMSFSLLKLGPQQILMPQGAFQTGKLRDKSPDLQQGFTLSGVPTGPQNQRLKPVGISQASCGQAQLFSHHAKTPEIELNQSQLREILPNWRHIAALPRLPDQTAADWHKPLPGNPAP